MTREETKVKTFDVLHFVADNAGISTFEAIEKAYNMGVSEQEPVLDKIRAEIEEQKKDRCFDDEDMFVYRTGLDDALYIIDKYKAESEDID